MTRIAKNSIGGAQGRAARLGLNFARDAISEGGLGHLTPEQRRARKDWLAGWRLREGQYAGMAGIASENTPPEAQRADAPALPGAHYDGDPADFDGSIAKHIIEDT